jgi:hypothetical protein
VIGSRRHVGATGHVWSRAESGPAATTVSVQSAVGQKAVSYLCIQESQENRPLRLEARVVLLWDFELTED